MQQFYSVCTRTAICALLPTLLLFARPVSGQEQADPDNFNRANSNVVGGGWAETESGVGVIRVNGNVLQLRVNGGVTGRDFASKTTPGTYSTTLNTNNCTMTWAFNMQQVRPDPSGFDGGNYGAAVVLAGSSTNLSTGTGYAVVLGEGGATDRLRLVSYSGGLLLNSNLTDIIATGDFGAEFLDVRVTYVPGTNTWSLFYRNNGAGGAFQSPLTAATLGGSAVDGTHTGTDLPAIGCLWNHANTNGQALIIDDFYVPASAPATPVIAPTSATICSGGSQALTVSSSSTTTAWPVFFSTGGPATVIAAGANDASVYPWNLVVSGLPTSGVTIHSVTIDGITHTFPDDLDILLQSPTGANVTLMSDVGGTTDFADHTYTFQTGATAMSNGAVDPSGIYRPTNFEATDDYPTTPGPGAGFADATPSFSTFSGNFNGTWKLLIRDDANLDAGSVRSWAITFSYTNSLTYSWSPTTSPATGASVTASPVATDTYTVTAGQTANSCTRTGSVLITVLPAFSAGTVGSGDQTFCASGTPNAMSVSGATGSGSFAYQWYSKAGSVACPSGNSTATWTSLGATNGANTATYTPVAAVSATTTYACFVTPGGTPTCGSAQWAGGCRQITVNPAATANAGGPYTACGTSPVSITATASGAGTWSGGAGTFASASSTSTTYTPTIGEVGGPAITLTWTTNDPDGAGPCAAVPSNASLTVNTPATANAGGPYTACGTSPVSITATASGAGSWSGGAGTFASAGSTTTTYTPTIGEVGGPAITLTWTTNDPDGAGPCAAVPSNASLTVNTPATANAGGPYTACGTSPVSITATASGAGTWSGGAGTFASASSTSTTYTPTIGEVGGPAITLTWTTNDPDGAGPCSAVPSNASITVNTPATANANGPYATCGTTPAAISATTNGTGTWSGGAGTFGNPVNSSTTYTPDVSEMGTTVMLTWTTDDPDGAGPCAAVPSTAASFVVNICAYYSQISGNVAAPIWSPFPVGAPGPATFGSAVSMIVQSPNVVTNTTNVQVNDLTVDAGGTLVLNAPTLSVNGTSAVLNGTITANDNSTLALVGTSAATLSATGTKLLYNLTVSDAAGVTVTGAFEFRGTLQLNSGNFNASAATVRLRSLSTGTARLGPVDPSASYTGNMIVDRRIPGGATNWRMLGSPVVGRTVADWQDDFLTAGYPGSQYPTFDDPVGSGNLWPSIRWYDEPDPGPADIDGVEGVSSSAQALTMGQGFAVWCGDMLGGTNPFLIDLVGAPNIASSPIALPMSWTNNGAGSDGWNLVSNPVPSPILFSAISRGADVDDYVTYYDPSNGNTATYQIGVGGVNGGTDVIQGSQGFFLKATGSAVATTVEESDKTSGNGGGFFGGDEETTLSALRLKVTSGINTYADETMVVFDLGTPELDGSDALKYVFAHPAAPQVATIAPTGELFAINAYGAFTNAISIPVMVNAAVSGTYTVTATGVASLGLTCVTLEDLITGDVTPLTEGASYSFAMSADDDATAPRLMVHATVPMAFEATDATCGGMANGQATVSVAGGPLDVTWTDLVGTVLLQQNAVTGDATFGGLAAGSYMVHVGTNTACGELVSEFTIDAPFVLDGATVASTPSTCADSEDGSIDVMVMGGVEPYTYTWSNGSDAQDLVAGAGNYTLTVTDANDCEWNSDVFTIDAGGAQAGFTVMGGTLLVNTDVLFTNTSTPDAEYLWEFGDGGTSTDVDGVHAYELPGTYTVTLTVTSGGCTDVSTFDLTVEMNTGISTIAVVGTNAWTSPNGFVVEHNFTEPVLIEVLDATGRLQATRQAPGTPGRVVLSHEGLSTGIWFVRVTSGTAQQTFRLPLLR